MKINCIESKPKILIFVKNGIGKNKFEDILWGIEEEGIPYSVMEYSESSSCCLAGAAASESILGVGLGIDEKKITLNYEKLSADDFIFSIDVEDEAVKKRELGESAARLVKKIPFKCKFLK